MSTNLENSAVATGREKSVFIPIPKKGNPKECSNYQTVALISYAIKVMLKSLQARLQQYMNHELPDGQAGFRKGRGTRHQMVTFSGSLKKQASSRKTSTSALLTMPKPLTVWITTNCGNSSRDGNTRPPYLPPEKSVCRSRNKSKNWTWNNRLVPNWEKSALRLYIVTCLFNFYAEYIM